MDYKEVESIKIDGNYFEKELLISFSKSNLKKTAIASWQTSIFTFLLNWLDDKDFIVVKTSGSTGTPKFIKIKKQQMLNSAFKTGEFLDLKKNNKALLCLSADFIAGKMMLVRSMALGLDLKISEPSGNPLKNTYEHFDFAAMVPMQVFTILQDEDGINKLNRIKNLIIGGAPVSSGLKQKINLLTNNTFSTYGMTETVSHIAMEKLNGSEADGYLHLLPGIKIENDLEKRLIIDAPEICDAVIITNDLAEIREDGSFRILGRSDNMIISGGIKIIPEIIEKKLEKLIDERFIISSIRDEKLGEKLVLVIEGNSRQDENIDSLKNNIAKNLDRLEIPKEIIFISKFEVTGDQKINRLAIKTLLIRGNMDN